MTEKTIGETDNCFVLFDNETGEGKIGRKGGGEVYVNGASEARYLSFFVAELYDWIQMWERDNGKSIKPEIKGQG